MPTFTTLGPVTVDVDLGAGSVHVIASDRDDTLVTLLPWRESKSVDSRAVTETTVELVGDRLVVRTPRGWRYYGPFESGGVNVTVELPSGSSVEGRTGFGALVAEGRLGSVRFKTGSGDLRVDDAERLELKTSSGTVAVGRVTGPAELSTAAGTVRLRSVAGSAVVKNPNGATVVGEVTGSLEIRGSAEVDRVAGSLTARAAYGELRVERVESGSVTLDTNYGGVEVGVPLGTAVWLDVTSRHGAVRNLLEASGAPAEGDRTAELHVTTGWGNVLLRRPEEVLR